MNIRRSSVDQLGNLSRRYRCIAIFIAMAATQLLTGALPAKETRNQAPPNIVVILVDDMGFSDIGCYGGEIETPNLDSLAENGLRFRQFYNTGRCCPTRAALLTGLFSHQAGVGHMTGDYGVRGYRGHLSDQAVTLGQVAHDAGYLSAATGKWHVGDKEPAMRPIARGFDRFFGVPEGGGFYFKVKTGRTIMLNEEVVYSPSKQVPDGWYSSDAFTEQGLKFVDEAIAADKPFLLYLAHNAPHFPLQAPAKDIARFRGRYQAGWDKLSQERFERQIKMGLVDADWKRAPRPDRVQAWNKLSDEEKDRYDHMMATYAACVFRMDQSVGALVAGLKERGHIENTLILFMSDNGGCAESGPKGRTIGDPTTPDSNWFCGESWAWLQDTPFRKFKHFNHEGGIATPLIAHWPAKIQDRGAFRDQPAHVIDVMATLVDLVGGKYPAEKNGVAILPYEGKSLLPAFADKPLDRESLFWEHEGNAAIRKGDWKLVRAGAKKPWELYDLSVDRTEAVNLISQHPDKAETLKQEWHAWAKRCFVSTTGLPKRKR